MSGYSQLPSQPSDPKKDPATAAETRDPAAPHTSARDRAAETARIVAEKLGAGLHSGLARAGTALAAPKGTDIESLISETNLPELVQDDPIGSLAIRLDREADLWRNFSLREIARLGWADRIAQAICVLAVLADIALGVVAALAALFGGDNAPGKVLLLGGAALSVMLGAIVVAQVTRGIRRTRHSLAREALARADLAELRLHRVGIVLGWRKQDPALYQEALARLERDAND
jgi:hypothetical protein